MQSLAAMEGSPTKRPKYDEALAGWDEDDEDDVVSQPSAPVAVDGWMSDCDDEESDVAYDDGVAAGLVADVSTPTPNSFARMCDVDSASSKTGDSDAKCLVPSGFASNFDASGREPSEHVIMDGNGSIVSTGSVSGGEKASLEMIQIPPSPSRDATTEIQRSQMKEAKNSIDSSESLGRKLLVNDVKRMKEETWSVLDIVTQGLDKQSKQQLQEQAADGLMTSGSHPEISTQLQRWMNSSDESLKRTARFLYRSLFMPTDESDDFNVGFLDSLDNSCYIKAGEHLDYVLKLLRKHGSKKGGKGSLVTSSTALHNGVLIPRTRTLFEQLARTAAKSEDKALCPNGVEHCAAMNWLSPPFPSLPIADFCVKQAFKLESDVPCVFCQLRSSLETSVIFQMQRIPVPASKLTMSSYTSLCWSGADGFNPDYAYISNMPSGVCGPSLLLPVSGHTFVTKPNGSVEYKHDRIFASPENKPKSLN